MFVDEKPAVLFRKPSKIKDKRAGSEEKCNKLHDFISHI
jgi:hypothetical protein